MSIQAIKVHLHRNGPYKIPHMLQNKRLLVHGETKFVSY